jgi:6,7-dimethyl-8-ribityllumazine synthase
MSTGGTETRGGLRADGLRFGVVVSRFNSFITERLLAAALDVLRAAGAEDGALEIVRVPGSFEIPVAAKQLARTGRVDAIVCIGCILRGETTHYDYVCSESARGIMLAQMDTGVPMAFCVLTCDTLEQARRPGWRRWRWRIWRENFRQHPRRPERAPMARALPIRAANPGARDDAASQGA